MREKTYSVLFAFIGFVSTGTAAADLSGRVVQDDSGSPVVAAEVRIYRVGVPGLAADLETDGEGRFAAPALPDGEYRIEIAKPNFLSSRVLANAANTASEGPVTRLIRTAAISGRVSTADGKAVNSAMVFAIPTGSRHATQRASVDSNGQYRLHGLAPGEYQIAASYGASTANVGSRGQVPPASPTGSGLQFYPSNTRPRAFLINGGEDLRGIEIVVLPGALAAVSGKVELPEPKITFWIALSAVDQPAIATAVTIADEDGSFRFEGVPAGSYHVLASGPSRGYGMEGAMLGSEAWYARSRVDVSGREVAGIALGPQKGRSVNVKLAVEPGAESACPQTARVTVQGLEDWAAVPDQRRAAVGRGRDTVISGLAPSRFGLRLSELGDQCYQVAEAVLDLTGNASAVAIHVAGAGSLRGRVLRKATEQVVALLPLDGERLVRNARTRGDGSFSFSALPPGRYQVSAGKSRMEITIASGRTLEVELAVVE